MTRPVREFLFSAPVVQCGNGGLADIFKVTNIYQETQALISDYLY